jgi:hypothetical protein
VAYRLFDVGFRHRLVLRRLGAGLRLLVRDDQLQRRLIEPVLGRVGRGLGLVLFGSERGEAGENSLDRAETRRRVERAGDLPVRPGLRERVRFFPVLLAAGDGQEGELVGADGPELQRQEAQGPLFERIDEGVRDGEDATGTVEPGVTFGLPFPGGTDLEFRRFRVLAGKRKGDRVPRLIETVLRDVFRLRGVVDILGGFESGEVAG